MDRDHAAAVVAPGLMVAISRDAGSGVLEPGSLGARQRLARKLERGEVDPEPHEGGR